MGFEPFHLLAVLACLKLSEYWFIQECAFSDTTKYVEFFCIVKKVGSKSNA